MRAVRPVEQGGRHRAELQVAASELRLVHPLERAYLLARNGQRVAATDVGILPRHVGRLDAGEREHPALVHADRFQHLRRVRARVPLANHRLTGAVGIRLQFEQRGRVGHHLAPAGEYVALPIYRLGAEHARPDDVPLRPGGIAQDVAEERQVNAEHERAFYDLAHGVRIEHRRSLRGVVQHER